MNAAMASLNNISAVISTEQPPVSKFVVASFYGASKEKNGHEAGNDQSPNRWTVVVGCEGSWWGTHLQESVIQDLIEQPRRTELEDEAASDAEAFADKIRSAFERNSVLFGVSCSVSSHPPSSWKHIKLYIDLEHDPVEIKLTKMSAEMAVIWSTKVILRCERLSSSSSGSSSYEVEELQSKLEATQQALREERHKYRSLLAAPSASHARTGKRPVVGLGPRLPTASQPSSSLSSSSRGVASSSSGAGPSSDDLADGTQRSRTWSRTLSIVNPTRVQRADRSDNDAFIGDEDEDEAFLASQREATSRKRQAR